jgi:hypothetical protein
MTPTFARQTSITPPAIALLSARSRHALVAALKFLDGAALRTLDVSSLDAWLQRYLVGTGWMPWPGQVSERMAGRLALMPGERATPEITARCESIVHEARAQVVLALRSFIGPESDDRFLAAAIFRGRVQRDSRGMMAAWVPQPHIEDPLSEIVLSLFAADILGNRESYERALGVCRACGRVSFDPSGLEKPRCPAHG